VFTLLAAEEGANNPLRLPLDELVIGTIAFLIVFGLLAKFVFPRVAKTLDERTETIEGGIKRAEEAQEEAQRALESYRAQLATARHEAAQIRERAREEGAAIIAELREHAQAEARRITQAANQQIEADRERAVIQLRAEIGQLATELAGRIVGEALADDARQRRVIDRFLEDLESASAEPAGRAGAGTSAGSEPAGS
jgi:F-type H+-transporting ATPase subunit b